MRYLQSWFACAGTMSVVALASGPVLGQTPTLAPTFSAGAFRGSVVDNAGFPLRPGELYVYQVSGEGPGTAVDSIKVTDRTETVAGVHAVVVRDRLVANGAVSEDTFDWYAQDTSGAVWYMGEDTRAYKAGKVVSTEGSWRAGVAGATPGLIMPARPHVGDVYRQEYRPKVSEDMARIVAVDTVVTVPGGRFEHCVATEDWSPLEPKVRERKAYCPGVGLVEERAVAGGREHMELVSHGK